MNEEPWKIRHQSAALLTDQFTTTFDNEVGLLSYSCALTEVDRYDNWDLQ